MVYLHYQHDQYDRFLDDAWMIVQALALAESLQLSLNEEGTLLPLLARSWGKKVYASRGI